MSRAHFWEWTFVDLIDEMEGTPGQNRSQISKERMYTYLLDDIVGFSFGNKVRDVGQIRMSCEGGKEEVEVTKRTLKVRF